MTNKQLQEFVISNPEFFEKAGDYFVLRADIQNLVEEYARLVDPDEFERVRQLVAEIQHYQLEELKQEIKDFQNEVLRWEKQLHDLQSELQRHDDQTKKLNEKIVGLNVQISRLANPEKPFYASNLVFWFVIITGITLVYMGFFVDGSVKLLPVGFFFLGLGIILQNLPTTSAISSRNQISQLQAEIGDQEKMIPGIKLKRATVMQQIIVARQTISQLRRNINDCENRKEIIDDK